MLQGKPLESTYGIFYLGIRRESLSDLKIVSGMFYASRRLRALFTRET
jgi:hypothetical protein